jgi:hypothetical protein
MHPVNNKFFGTDGVAVKFYNGTTTKTGYIIKQLGTDRFVVTDGTTTSGVLNTYTAYLVNTYAQATSLARSTITAPPDGNSVTGPAYQMTIPVPFTTGSLGYVTHIYSTQVDVISSASVLSRVNWSLGTAVDGSTALESFATAYDATNTPTYAAGTFGGPTTLAFVAAPPTGVTHGATTYTVTVSTTPNTEASNVGNLFVSTSATVLPTTGGVENSSYLDGVLGFTMSYPSAGTYFVWVTLADTSYLISTARVIA